MLPTSSRGNMGLVLLQNGSWVWRNPSRPRLTSAGRHQEEVRLLAPKVDTHQRDVDKAMVIVEPRGSNKLHLRVIFAIVQTHDFYGKIL